MTPPNSIIHLFALWSVSVPSSHAASIIGVPAPSLTATTATANRQAADTHLRTAIINQSFDGYKVLRAVPETPEALKVLQGLVDDPALDFWTFPAGVMIPVDIMSPPENLKALEDTFKNNKISYSVVMDNLDEKIDDTLFTERHRAPIADFTFGEYHDTSSIYKQLDEWAELYPDLVSVSSIGKSANEEKEIRLLTIKSSTLGTQPKPAMFIDGGIHAREWISPATAMYFARKLLDARNNADTRFLLEEFDWYLVPVLNPDGYDYTHSSRLNRLWRKNRSGAPRPAIPAPPAGLWGRRISLVTDQLSRQLCPGVDLNRNFAFQWFVGGSSEWACSEIYAGPVAESEAETKALSQFLLRNKKTIKSYITLHSYGRAVLTPWGYTKEFPARYAELTRMGGVLRDAIQASAKADGRDSTYSLGSAANLFYIASGGSDDFALGAAGIPYSYTVELPDEGTYGFLLPPSQIPVVGKDTFAGLAAYSKELAKTLKDSGSRVDALIGSGTSTEDVLPEIIQIAETTPATKQLAAEPAVAVVDV